MKKISTYSADRFPMAIFLGQMADYKFSPLLASTLESMIGKNYFDSLCPLKAARLIVDFGSLFVPYGSCFGNSRSLRPLPLAQ
jgi:hypothetical protein